MKPIRRILIAVSAAAALGAAAWQGTTFHVTKTIPLGIDGGWDYLTFDSDAGRLFISRGGASMVQVVDLKASKLVGTIDSTHGVHGIALAPEFGRGYTSNGGDSTVTIFDLKSLKQIAKVTVTGRNPDAILYDPFSKRVFTFNHSGHNTTALDAATGKVLGTAKTDGTLETGQSDLAGTIFVNDEEGNRVFAFDARTLEVKAAWPLAGCTAPTGLAIDRAHKRLFAACNESKTIAVVDYATGKTVATPPICSGADAAAFDSGLQLVFASCGDGNITVIHEDTPDKYTVLGNAATEPRARTMTIDEKSHTLYTATARYSAEATPPAGGRGRASMVPGSFHVLVLGR
ncbi:MAG: YncE family protein [Gemmatimonadaceae bacterium]|nr:YncE family protein [Gemmatimonadaceae bacterium]